MRRAAEGVATSLRVMKPTSDQLFPQRLPRAPLQAFTARWLALTLTGLSLLTLGSGPCFPYHAPNSRFSAARPGRHVSNGGRQKHSTSEARRHVEFPTASSTAPDTAAPASEVWVNYWETTGKIHAETENWEAKTRIVVSAASDTNLDIPSGPTRMNFLLSTIRLALKARARISRARPQPLLTSVWTR